MLIIFLTVKSFCKPDLTWTNKPVCNPVQCFSPMLVTYSSVIFQVHDTKKGVLTTKTNIDLDYVFTYGEKLYYKCDRGYYDINKSKNPIVCDVRDPGSLKGRWNNSFPECKPVPCHEPLSDFV